MTPPQHIGRPAVPAVSPAENDRLLGHVPHILGARATRSDWELNFLRGVRSRHKRNPALVLKPGEARWLEPIVARFLRETLGGTGDEGQGA